MNIAISYKQRIHKWVSPEWVTTEYELKELDADTIWNTRQTIYFGD